jgi:hypothetical protein
VRDLTMAKNRRNMEAKIKPITTLGRGMWKRQHESVVSINGHMIRPVRTGARVLFSIDGTAQRFTDLERAETFAAGLC